MSNNFIKAGEFQRKIAESLSPIMQEAMNDAQIEADRTGKTIRFSVGMLSFVVRPNKDKKL